MNAIFNGHTAFWWFEKKWGNNGMEEIGLVTPTYVWWLTASGVWDMASYWLMLPFGWLAKLRIDWGYLTSHWIWGKFHCIKRSCDWLEFLHFSKATCRPLTNDRQAVWVVLTNLPLVQHVCVIESDQQVMAYRLFSGKPLSKPMLGYCQLDPYGQISVKF